MYSDMFNFVMISLTGYIMKIVAVSIFANTQY